MSRLWLHFTRAALRAAKPGGPGVLQGNLYDIYCKSHKGIIEGVVVGHGYGGVAQA